jgi:hypothetical protein
MRAAELGVVIVMVVVRASPNAAGTQGEDAKDSHQSLGEAGAGQYCVVLLIVINHEKPQHQQAGKKTAGDSDGQRKIQERTREGCRQKKRRRENTPPTPGGGVRRVRFRCQYKIFSGSQTNSSFYKIRPLPVLCRGYSDNDSKELQSPDKRARRLKTKRNPGINDCAAMHLR